jgi:hypothetical protein
MTERIKAAAVEQMQTGHVVSLFKNPHPIAFSESKAIVSVPG